MSVVSTMRGRHSSGFCYVPFIGKNSDLRPEPHIIKSVGSPFSIFHNKDGQDALDAGFNKGSSVFGHNRHATKGSIKLANAHPFREGNWTLVHNGTLWGGVELSPGVEVDSHALCKRIDDEGIKQALMTIDGAYAIIAYEQDTGKIYVARNGQRPLHYYEHDHKTYVMSDPDDLQYALKKVDRWRYYKEMGETGKIEELKEHVLYVVTPEGLKDVDSVKPAPKYYEVGTYKPYVSPAASTTISGNNAHVGGSDKEFMFRVEAIIKQSEMQYKYLATATGGEKIFFYTNVHDMEKLHRYGCAKARTKITDSLTNTTTYQVRFREIEWEDSILDPVGSGRTVEVCSDCASPIEDVTDAIKILNGHYICGTCVDEFKKSGFTVHEVARD